MVGESGWNYGSKDGVERNKWWSESIGIALRGSIDLLVWIIYIKKYEVIIVRTDMRAVCFFWSNALNVWILPFHNFFKQFVSHAHLFILFHLSSLSHPADIDPVYCKDCALKRSVNLQKRVVVLILVSLIFLDLEKHCDAMDVCDCISFVWCVEQF